MTIGQQSHLQDTFLSHVRKHKTPLTIFLLNGIKLQGALTSFDKFSVELTRESQSQLILKSAIATILPLGPIDLAEVNKTEK
jgi:host factor-I protein